MDFRHPSNFHHVDSDDGDNLSFQLRDISSRNSFDSDYCRFKDPIPTGDLLCSTSSSDFDREPMSSSRETNASRERGESGPSPYTYPGGTVVYSSRKMETTILPDKLPIREPVPISGSSPSNSPLPLPMRTVGGHATTETHLHTTVTKTTTEPVRSSGVRTETATYVRDVQPATFIKSNTSGSTSTYSKDVTDIASRSPLRSIHEIKASSHESHGDSGHGSSHGLLNPQTTAATEFQPFYKIEFDNNPATESSKLLSTPTKRVERENNNEERPVTPLIGLSSASKQDLQRSQFESKNTTWKYLSLLYAIVLVVLGCAYPFADIFSIKVRPMFYQAYYVFLFGGSLLFLVFAYFFLLQTGRRHRKPLLTFIRRKGGSGFQMETVESEEDARLENHRPSIVSGPTGSKTGSFYLRMGALLFGIGSMIYSCLEFGQYFEYQMDSECLDVLNALVPALRFLFSFVQLYFVFLIAKIRIDRMSTLVRFGLMHMIATNICIWLSVVIGETRHELELSLTENRVTPAGFEDHPYPLGFFRNFTSHPTGVLEYKKPLNMYMRNASNAMAAVLERYPQSCRAQTIIGNILQKASPFLFPCVVEYSLICAAMLYVMWARMRTTSRSYAAEETSLSTMSLGGTSKRQRYTVDCNGATRGLFAGILMLVVTIISVILYFVWVWRRDYYPLAVFQSFVVEIATYSITLIAVAMALYQVRDLKFEASEGSFLNDLLLIISQSGVYIFTAFVLLSSHHLILENPERGDLFALLSALLEVIQATLQTLFLLDATRRRPFKQEHLRNKPGRELVTFLLVCNFGLWAIDSLEVWKQQLYPAQTRFYGSWAWTVVMNVSMPLTIFYRFHSSVCLAEVWKKAWKLKSRPSTPVAIA